MDKKKKKFLNFNNLTTFIFVNNLFIFQKVRFPRLLRKIQQQKLPPQLDSKFFQIKCYN